jgi:hypothetical protein
MSGQLNNPPPSLPAPPPADVKLLFEQYKLAVEMAQGISDRRQTANSFYIALISAFGILSSVLEKGPTSEVRSTWGYVLSILPACLSVICLCVVWWLTIQSYRRINKAKWKVIEELEDKLPNAPGPFTLEGRKLKEERAKLKEGTISITRLIGVLRHLFNSHDREEGTFSITRSEAVIPFLVCLVFLLLAGRPLLEWLARSTRATCQGQLY